jgi:hypothetical protein
MALGHIKSRNDTTSILLFPVGLIWVKGLTLARGKWRKRCRPDEGRAISSCFSPPFKGGDLHFDLAVGMLLLLPKNISQDVLLFRQ